MSSLLQSMRRVDGQKDRPTGCQSVSVPSKLIRTRIFHGRLLSRSISILVRSHLDSDMSPNTPHDQDKRVRREIANCNERRRMQSINTGFQSLKVLIPHSCGEKLSKVGDHHPWSFRVRYERLFSRLAFFNERPITSKV